MVEKEDDLDIPWLVDHFAEITYTTTLVDPEVRYQSSRFSKVECPNLWSQELDKNYSSSNVSSLDR